VVRKKKGMVKSESSTRVTTLSAPYQKSGKGKCSETAGAWTKQGMQVVRLLKHRAVKGPEVILVQLQGKPRSVYSWMCECSPVS
jgi:hypothetical protein